jgi:hypothetical protein
MLSLRSTVKSSAFHLRLRSWLVSGSRCVCASKFSSPVTQRRVTTVALPTCSRHNAHTTFADIQEPTGRRKDLFFIALRVALRAIVDPAPGNVDRVSIVFVCSGLGMSALHQDGPLDQGWESTHHRYPEPP